MRAATSSASGGRGASFGLGATSSAGGAILSAAAAAAQRRAAVALAASRSQRPADPPLTSGSGGLPSAYDRAAVQVALDDVFGQLSERLLALETRRGG